MDYFVLIFYPLLAFLLLKNAKIFKKSDWNDSALSLSQTKAIQGFTAILIIFHHIAQKTCAYWLESKYIHHGLEPFVPIGYLFVAIFFFYSGYGLLKSYKTKDNYLQRFLPRRLSPLFVASVLIGFLYLCGRVWLKANPSFFILTLGDPALINPNGWFPYTIAVFYIGFYLAYRFCKNKKTALIVTCAIVLAYIFYCDIMIYGTWWYNSVPAFMTGLIVAENEEKIIAKIKKHYLSHLIILTVLTGIFLYFSVQHKISFIRFIPLFAEMASSVTFVLLILVISLKIKVGNKMLDFLGGMTLEIYLIHGLFVNLFGYCFIVDRVEPFYYISNPALFSLVVLAISLPLAFLFKIIDKAIVNFFSNRPKLAHSLNKDARRVLIVLACIILVICICESNISRSDSKERLSKYIKPYIEENITFVDVGSRKMAADITGEGKHTIVICSPTAPSLTFKELASRLSNENKIILLDTLGTGFSEMPETPRTTENIVREIHDALHGLGEEGPFIFITHINSGIHTLAYANTYPEDVEAVIGLDSFLPAEFFEKIKTLNLNEREFKRENTHLSRTQFAIQKLLNFTGLVRWEFATFESIFKREHNEDFMIILEEAFKTSYNNRTSYEEKLLDYENNMYVRDMKYSDDIPTFMLIGYYTWKNKYYFGDWYEMHSESLSAHPLSLVKSVNGDIFTPYINANMYTVQIREILSMIDGQQ